MDSKANQMLVEGEEAFGAVKKAQVAAGATKLQTEQDWAWALHQAALKEKDAKVKKALDSLADELLTVNVAAHAA